MRFLFRRWCPPTLAALGLLTALPASAQITIRDADRVSAHFGLTTGLNITSLVDAKLRGDPNYQSRTTYHSQPIGFTAGVHFNEHNGVQVEANHVRQGTHFVITDSRNGDRLVGTKDVLLTYWSVPLLYKYTAAAAAPVRFELHLGPQLNFLRSGIEVNRYSGNAVLVASPSTTDLTGPNSNLAVTAGTEQQLAAAADFRSTTFSGVFGLGVEYQIKNTGFYVSTVLRGTYSLGDVRSADRVEKAKAVGYYNTRQSAVLGGQIGLHYQFIQQAEGHPKDRSF